MLHIFMMVVSNMYHEHTYCKGHSRLQPDISSNSSKLAFICEVDKLFLTTVTYYAHRLPELIVLQNIPIVQCFALMFEKSLVIQFSYSSGLALSPEAIVVLKPIRLSFGRDSTFPPTHSSPPGTAHFAANICVSTDNLLEGDGKW